MRQQVIVKVLDHTSLGCAVEIDQDVAAEDQVEVLQQNHVGVIEEVDAAEFDIGFELCVDLQTVATSNKIFLPKIFREISSAVFTVKTLFGMGHGTLVQIR